MDDLESTTAESGGPAGPLKVWWVPQVPMEPFEYFVPDIKTGGLLCDALARYDLFQLANNIKPDYSNAGGIAYLDEDGDWTDVDPDDPDEVADAERVLAELAAKRP